MTDEARSPLRRRMIEDMTIRKFAPKTQHSGRCCSRPSSRSRCFSCLECCASEWKSVRCWWGS
jgi:hypothetical protein